MKIKWDNDWEIMCTSIFKGCVIITLFSDYFNICLTEFSEDFPVVFCKWSDLGTVKDEENYYEILGAR